MREEGYGSLCANMYPVQTDVVDNPASVMLGRILIDSISLPVGSGASVLLVGDAPTDFEPSLRSFVGSSVGEIETIAHLGLAADRSFDLVWLLETDPADSTVLDAAELVGTTGRLVWSSSGSASAATDYGSDEELRARLGAYGLSAQHTLYPWPSPDRPDFVFSAGFLQDAGRLPALAAVIESAQPLGWTDRDLFSSELPAIVASLVATELFPSTINIAAVDPEHSFAGAWSFAGVGLDVWTAVHSFLLTSDGLVRTSDRIDESQGRAELGWLSLNTGTAQSVAVGPTLLDELLAAFKGADTEAAATVLKRWKSALADQVTAAPMTEAASPFASSTGDHLPGRYVDARFSNVSAGPELELLAPSWHVAGDVSLEIVETRGLWDLAHYLVTSGAVHPWAAEASVADVTQSLGELGGIAIGPSRLQAWRLAESALCARLFGGDDGDYVDHLIDRSSVSRLDMVDALPTETTDEIVDELRSQVTALSEALDLAVADNADLQRALDATETASSARIEDLEWDLAEVSRDRDRLGDKVDAQAMLNSEVLRKYERAVHERNMIEQGMNGYRQAVGVAKRVLPSQAYFRVRKIVRGH